MEVGEGLPVAVKEQEIPRLAERSDDSLCQEIEERCTRLEREKPEEDAELFRMLGYPRFTEMTPEEISEDEELLFHSTPRQYAIEILTRGSIDSTIAQERKYGEARIASAAMPGYLPKEATVSFSRGGLHVTRGPEGIVFAFRARDILPGTLFEEGFHPESVTIFEPGLDPERSETAKGAEVSLANKDFIILVREEGGGKFIEEVRKNWNSFSLKDKYRNVDEFIEKHVVEQPTLYERKIQGWFIANKQQIMDSFEGLQREIVENDSGSFERWASKRERECFRSGGLTSDIRHVINDYDRDNPQGISWNFSEQLLALRMLEQEFNRRFPPKEPRPLVKVEETDKKFGFRGETPLRRAIRINP